MNAPFSADDTGTQTVVRPKKQTEHEKDRKRQPRYNVILWDSDNHSFEYVGDMLKQLFGHNQQQCKILALEVDQQGKAIVLTTTKEHAELKRDQIHAFGKDDVKGCVGSMWATIEPAA